MKRIAILMLALLFAAPLFSDPISFHGKESSLSLKEGEEEVILKGDAYVSVDTLSIKSDEIKLSGTDWRYVECSGKTEIVDEERELEIKANKLWFDRIEEKLLLSPWFELEDKKEVLSATGGSLSYDMKNETLDLMMLVTIMKDSDKGIMRCKAESVTFSRKDNELSLKGSARVLWAGDEYKAEVIRIDLDSDEITLEGRIKGNINGS